MPKIKTAAWFALCCVVLGAGIAADAPKLLSNRTAGAAQDDPRKDKVWQAVAPGRVEPRTGEIRIAASILAPIAQVLVKANDKVLAGEPLIRLQDDDLRARVAAADAQAGLRLRMRNEQSATGKASDRRKAEDAVYDAEKSLIETRTTFDNAALARRTANSAASAVDSARTALTRAEERLAQRRTDLQKIESDAPLPTALESQLTAARAERQVAQAALDRMTIRAPISGSVLQVNAKPGELASPSALQTLVSIGDMSALRVRAELDERDFGEIRIGQQVTVRAGAFADREFSGKVSFIAPIVQPGSSTSRGPGNMADVDVAEVLVELAEPGPLAPGMKVDVYFRREAASTQ